jgi:hypothetical protein
VAASPDLQSQLRLHDAAAQALRNERYRHGALNIETIETRLIMLNDQVVSVEQQGKNRATELIEDFMIASNEVVARLLEARKVSSIRRVVKTPKRWIGSSNSRRHSGTPAGRARFESAQRLSWSRARRQIRITADLSHRGHQN